MPRVLCMCVCVCVCVCGFFFKAYMHACMLTLCVPVYFVCAKCTYINNVYRVGPFVSACASECVRACVHPYVCVCSCTCKHACKKKGEKKDCVWPKASLFTARTNPNAGLPAAR